MAKAIKNIVTETSNVVAPIVDTVEPTAIEMVSITLPKGSKVTTSKRTIIAPPHATTANKERWFEVKRLQGYVVNDGLITITLPKHALGYRSMLTEEA